MSFFRHQLLSEQSMEQRVAKGCRGRALSAQCLCHIAPTEGCLCSVSWIDLSRHCLGHRFSKDFLHRACGALFRCSAKLRGWQLPVKCSNCTNIVLIEPIPKIITNKIIQKLGTACLSLSDALPYSAGCPASPEEWVVCSSPATEEGLEYPLGQLGSWGSPGREEGTFSGLDLPPETCRGTAYNSAKGLQGKCVSKGILLVQIQK